MGPLVHRAMTMYPLNDSGQCHILITIPDDVADARKFGTETCGSRHCGLVIGELDRDAKVVRHYGDARRFQDVCLREPALFRSLGKAHRRLEALRLKYQYKRLELFMWVDARNIEKPT